jgi:arginine repressor
LKYYFRKGYVYQDIVDNLKQYHSMDISLRTLKRDLNKLGLRRRKEVTSDVLYATNAVVASELQGPGYIFDSCI